MQQERHREDLERPATISDPLLACCLCRRLLQEAVQLTCLHCCCRQCFNSAALNDSSKDVSCSICGTVTQAGSEVLNGFIDSQVTRYKVLADSKACGPCKGNGEHGKTALVWCSGCLHSLCGDCITVHGQYFRQHVTQSLEDLESLDELRLPASPSASCSNHNKPLEIACLNCERTMCISCWAECKNKKHEMYIVGEEALDNFVGTFIANILTLEKELLLKSKVLKMPKSILRNTKEARDRHLEDLHKRKRCVVDALETVYQQIEVSTKTAFDDIEADEQAKVASAKHIACALSDAESYVRRLLESNDKCEILNQQKIVQGRLRALSTELDSLSDRLSTTMREVKIESSLPEDLEDLFRAWIGIPLVFSAASSSSSLPSHLPQQQQEQQCFSFGPASVSVQLPVTCRDVALTKDGHSLLLAAGQHGLLEFSSSCGHELSHWRPLNADDQVLAVAALMDGRAAVSLHDDRVVVLLGRGEKVGSSSSSSSIASAAGEAWTVQLRFDPLPWYAYLLSAHGDVLAASLYWYGTELQLLSLTSRRRLSDAVLRREYAIGSLAIAAEVIVTSSYDKIDLGGGHRPAQVLDAHSLAEGDRDKRLWRHVMNSSDEKGEELHGIYADSNGGCLYAALCMSDRSSGRVCVHSLTDGSQLRRIALSCDTAAHPWRLSLCNSVALAAERKQRRSSYSSSKDSYDGSRIVLLAALDTNRRLVMVHHGCMHSIGQHN